MISGARRNATHAFGDASWRPSTGANLGRRRCPSLIAVRGACYGRACRDASRIEQSQASQEDRMRRRDFVALLGAAIAWSSMVAAQQVYRIGLLSTGAPIGENSPQATTLVRGLAEHGYELGRNLVIERRGAEAHPEHLPRLVEELVARKVDVIVTLGYPSALAAKQAAKLPVVSLGSGDP